VDVAGHLLIAEQLQEGSKKDRRRDTTMWYSICAPRCRIEMKQKLAFGLILTHATGWPEAGRNWVWKRVEIEI